MPSEARDDTKQNELDRVLVFMQNDRYTVALLNECELQLSAAQVKLVRKHLRILLEKSGELDQ